VATPFFEAHIGPALARALVVATKLGVFDALDKRMRTAEEVAGVCGLDPEATVKLLNALVGAQYVRTDHSGTSFRLAAMARRWLLASSPVSLRDFLVGLEINEWHWLEHYEAFLRTGQPLSIHDHMSADQWEHYQRAMRAVAVGSALEVARRTPVPPGARDLLDVGGSHGYFSVALCRRHPGLHAVVFDLPMALQSARQMLAREGMGERVVHRAGDATRDDFGIEAFDLVFISHLAHHFDAATNQDLVRRSARALRPGGLVVIQEGIRPVSSEAGDQAGAVLDLFCALTSGSRQWTFEEMADWQRQSGLVPLKPIRLRSAPGVGLQAGRKRQISETMEPAPRRRRADGCT
jgi:predicted O-methyltransferase YrrM